MIHISHYLLGSAILSIKYESILLARKRCVPSLSLTVQIVFLNFQKPMTNAAMHAHSVTCNYAFTYIQPGWEQTAILGANTTRGTSTIIYQLSGIKNHLYASWKLVYFPWYSARKMMVSAWELGTAGKILGNRNTLTKKTWHPWAISRHTWPCCVKHTCMKFDKPPLHREQAQSSQETTATWFLYRHKGHSIHWEKRVKRWQNASCRGL